MVWSVQNAQQMLAITEMQKAKSPRVVAILAGAFLDERLELSLKWRMRQDDEERLDKFFGDFGALGPYGVKVELAYLLGLYDLNLREALRGIGIIRNAFGHNLAQSFNSKQADFVKAIDRLTLHKGRTFYPNPSGDRTFQNSSEKIRTPRSNRELFLTNVRIALAMLMQEMWPHRPAGSHTSNLWFHGSDTKLVTDKFGHVSLREKSPRRTSPRS